MICNANSNTIDELFWGGFLIKVAMFKILNYTANQFKSELELVKVVFEI